MTWFGDSWGAPMCAPEEHAPTPIGQPCVWCKEVIQLGEQGVIYSNNLVAHAECMFRQVAGSVGHLKKECSCYKTNGYDDPLGMTLREAAREAVRIFEELHNTSGSKWPWYWERE